MGRDEANLECGLKIRAPLLPILMQRDAKTRIPQTTPTSACPVIIFFGSMQLQKVTQLRFRNLALSGSCILFFPFTNHIIRAESVLVFDPPSTPSISYRTPPQTNDLGLSKTISISRSQVLFPSLGAHIQESRLLRFLSNALPEVSDTLDRQSGPERLLAEKIAPCLPQRRN